MSTGTISATLDTVFRKYVGSECVVTATVKNSSGTATDPATITFKWVYQCPGASEQSVTMVNTATGIYTATFTPERPGTVSWRIDATTPTAALEGNISIADSRFALSA